MGSTFSFTNRTASTHDVTPVLIGPVTNYAKLQDEPTVAVFANKTAALDQGELLTYRCSDVAKVSTTQVIQNPLKVRNGVQYVIKVEEILRTTDTAGVLIGDEPIVAYLTVRHQKSGNITPALVEEVITRLYGGLYKADGTSRVGDLMRNALVPTTD